VRCTHAPFAPAAGSGGSAAGMGVRCHVIGLPGSLVDLGRAHNRQKDSDVIFTKSIDAEYYNKPFAWTR
jgi:hypothetical protein